MSHLALLKTLPCVEDFNYCFRLAMWIKNTGLKIWYEGGDEWDHLRHIIWGEEKGGNNDLDKAAWKLQWNLKKVANDNFMHDLLSVIYPSYSKIIKPIEKTVINDAVWKELFQFDLQGFK